MSNLFGVVSPIDVPAASLNSDTSVTFDVISCVSRVTGSDSLMVLPCADINSSVSISEITFVLDLFMPISSATFDTKSSL